MTRYREKESRSFHHPTRKLFNYQDQVISKTIDTIHARNKMADILPPLGSNKETSTKARLVLFYKNGDRNFRGHHVSITSRRFRSFDSLLNELTRITNLPQGVRFIFTPGTGSRVESLEELVDGHSYVCGSYPRLKKIDYVHGPDGSSRKRAANGVKNFIPAHASNNQMKIESNEKLPSNIKPKIVTIVRNSVARPKKTVKVLLNKRTAQTFEQVMNDITGAVGVEGGCVRKLYDINGKLVQNLTDLFADSQIFIAVGNERFRSCDLPYIAEDLVGVKKASSTNTTPGVESTRKKPKSISPHKKLPEIKPISRGSLSPVDDQPPEHINFDRTDIKSPLIDDRMYDRDNVLSDGDYNVLSDGDNDHPSSLNKKLPLPSIKSKHSSSSRETSDVTISVVGSKSEKSSNDDDNETNTNVSSTKNEDGADVASDINKLENTDVADDERATEDVNESSDTTSEKKSPTVDEVLTGNAKISTPSVTDSNKSTNSNNKSSEVNGAHKDTSSESSEESSSAADASEATTSTDDKSTEVSVNGSSTNEEKPEKPIKTEKPKRYINHKLNISEDINQFYEVKDILGDGNFAVVKTARDVNTNVLYALKVIDASKISGKEEMLQNEILIQRDANHPNIVALLHDFHSPTEIFLVMELITGGDFFDLIAENVRLEEKEASFYTKDLCSGLDYLHQRNIVHRDIKPENLMVCLHDDGKTSLKIADFGLAQKVTVPLFTICGTPTYVAPEIIKEEGYRLEVDVWAAGVIIYIMLCGFPPFRSSNRKQSELFDLIEAGEFVFLEPYWDDVSDAAKDLIGKILVTDAKKRFTCKDILNHVWLTQYGYTRNNTNEGHIGLSRFKAVSRTVLAIERMKKLKKKSVGNDLHRGENHIVTSGDESYIKS